MAEDDDIATELERLQEEGEKLRSEHAVLQRNPKDIAGHRAHQRALSAHKEKLQNLITRLQQRRSSGGTDD